MVKVLLIADVHANWPALKALSEEVTDADFIIHAGDTIGYGPFPNEVIEWMKTKVNVNVMGNHDYAIVSGNHRGFGDNSHIVLKWTDDAMTAQNLRYLSNLSDYWVGDVYGVKVGVVHGGMSNYYNEFIHPYTNESLINSYFTKLGVKVLITGHVHQMFIRELNSNYLINPGSVGQPRDGSPDPSYVIMTIEGGVITRIEPKRFKYNINDYKQKVVNEKLPLVFAERLFTGR